MELYIKQLSQNGQVFVPQTTSEAVLTKDSGIVVTLDAVLNKKIEQIETPAGSGLQAVKSNKIVYLTHSNQIEPNTSTQNLKVKYNNSGHIVETSPVEDMVVTVNQQIYSKYNGDTKEVLQFGNDFTIEDKNISLTWNNL